MGKNACCSCGKLIEAFTLKDSITASSVASAGLADRHKPSRVRDDRWVSVTRALRTPKLLLTRYSKPEAERAISTPEDGRSVSAVAEFMTERGLGLNRRDELAYGWLA